MTAPHGLWPPRNLLCALDVAWHISRAVVSPDPFLILDEDTRVRPVHDIARDLGHRTDRWLCRHVCTDHQRADWGDPGTAS